jgi:membrane-associated HD superfamily phosphohydrolase
MATSTQNLEKMGKATETMARTTQDSASTAMDYAVKAQEINTNLLQRTTGLWIEGLQRQADLSQEMAQQFFNKAEDQAQATQTFLDQWSKAFAGHPSTGFPFMRMAQRAVTNTQKATQQGLQTTQQVAHQGLRLAEEATEQTEETIRQTEEAAREAELRTAVLSALKTEDYNELTVEEISSKLEDLSVEDLRKVREYEKRNKDRSTLVEEIDKRLRLSS